MNSVAETLRAARAKIADPKHWIQGNYARLRKDEPLALDVRDPNATCWCAVGAFMATGGPYEGEAERLLAEVIERRSFDYSRHARDYIVIFNDTKSRRHRDVIRKFNEAIALAESREAGK